MKCRTCGRESVVPMCAECWAKQPDNIPKPSTPQQEAGGDELFFKDISTKAKILVDSCKRTNNRITVAWEIGTFMRQIQSLIAQREREMKTAFVVDLRRVQKDLQFPDQMDELITKYQPK